MVRRKEHCGIAGRSPAGECRKEPCWERVGWTLLGSCRWRLQSVWNDNTKPLLVLAVHCRQDGVTIQVSLIDKCHAQGKGSSPRSHVGKRFKYKGEWAHRWGW